MASKCVICGEQVFTQDASNVLMTDRGDKDCAGPYWIVYNKQARRAVATFLDRPGVSAMKRARQAAQRNPDYVARKVSPHGHQVK